MTTDRVNALNMGLMIGSCAAAFVLPFELFLFSYAVLGPLHYLTQISWLHTRGYFTTGRRDYLWLGGCAAALLLLRYVLTDVDQAGWAAAVVGLALGGAAAMAVERPLWKGVLVVATVVLAIGLRGLDPVQIVLLTFMPTIIHVYLFTAAFILFGALKGRSVTGIASLAVFVACTASFFVYTPLPAGRALSPYVRDTYALFRDVNVQLADWLRMSPIAGADVYSSRTGLVVMRFIAFAYTYHYLNWFSKTSIIQWHKIPLAWTVVNVILWLAALGLYAWDYHAGLLVLFGLSWLHVLLEFPLDHRTFTGIARELGRLARPPAAVPVPARTLTAAHRARRS
jgi:hypothetical protein